MGLCILILALGVVSRIVGQATIFYHTMRLELTLYDQISCLFLDVDLWLVRVMATLLLLELLRLADLHVMVQVDWLTIGSV